MTQLMFTRRRILAMAAIAVPGISLAQTDEVPDCYTVFSDSIIHDEPIAPMVRHSFEYQALPDLLSDPKSRVVVHHGRPVNDEDFTGVFAHTETLPVYWNSDSGVPDLSNDVVFGILSGKVSNWSEVGGNDTPVTVYSPHTPLKSQALAKQFESAALVANGTSWQKGGYQFQADGVAQDSGGIAVGLRSMAARSFNSAEVRQWSPCAGEGGQIFRVPIYIYVRNNDSDALNAAQNLLSITARRAKEDGEVYPVQDVFRSLSD